jgi:hypothetical protein
MVAMVALPLCVPTTAGHAQQAPTTPDAAQSTITVTGNRERKSSWRLAETDHVMVYGDGDRSDVARTALNLEKLHFLLSVLLNKVGTDGDKGKLRVYVVDDGAVFDAMDLTNVRSQEGPFADVFPPSHYYDPREDGAVLAASRFDQTVHLTNGPSLSSLQSYSFDPRTGETTSVLFGSANIGNLPSANAITVNVPSEARLYAGYARHFLLTYFPAAYPRWYVDGFGQLFSTVDPSRKATIEYGRSPSGFGDTIDRYPNLNLKQILNDTYLNVPEARSGWTPAAAWLLVHYLTFAPARKGQIAAYLAALKQGKSHSDAAAAAFGDPARLAHELAGYRLTKLPYEQMHYPEAMVGAPVVRSLTMGQAAFIKGRLELGSRLFLPPELLPGADQKAAKAMLVRHEKALKAQTRWLADLRRDAAGYPRDLDAQLLLTEAECRLGNARPCLDAADHALAISPSNAVALSWKGLAQAHQAATNPPEVRSAALQAARALIVRANHLDTEAPQPLLAYYRSFADVGETAPEGAVDGLVKVTQITPAAPTPRTLLGREYAAHGLAAQAHEALDPVARGPFDPPEKAAAEAALRSLEK